MAWDEATCASTTGPFADFFHLVCLAGKALVSVRAHHLDPGQSALWHMHTLIRTGELQLHVSVHAARGALCSCKSLCDSSHFLFPLQFFLPLNLTTCLHTRPQRDPTHFSLKQQEPTRFQLPSACGETHTHRHTDIHTKDWHHMPVLKQQLVSVTSMSLMTSGGHMAKVGVCTSLETIWRINRSLIHAHTHQHTRTILSTLNYLRTFS